MSRDDRARWDARYAAGAYAERTHPSALLRERLPRLGLAAGARVLDLACGAGRNALYLAAQGFAVTALDVSTVALERARASEAAQRNAGDWPSVDWRVTDLEAGLPPRLGAFDLILLIRYVNEPLLAALPSALAPGGWLLVEEHLAGIDGVGGPGRSAFRVPRGALRRAVPGLHCAVLEEGLVPDPDGSPMALARLLALDRSAR